MFDVLLCPRGDIGGGEDTETTVSVVLLFPRGDRGGGEDTETKTETENWFL